MLAAARNPNRRKSHAAHISSPNSNKNPKASVTPIPAFYRQGDEIEMKFSVYDQRSKPHSIRLTLWVDVNARRFKMSAPELPEDSGPEAEERWNRKLASAETVKKQIKVLVIGANHNIQHRQDTIPELAPVRDQFEQRLRQIIKEQKIDLIAEEAGDDTKVWENLKKQDLFGEIVDSPVPTIAKTVADENRVRHEDVDVDVRVVDEGDLESVKKSGEAIARKILKVLGAAEKVIVIVGEKHRSDVVQCIKGQGRDVVCMHFPE
jgi:hypothetical protein